MRPDVRNSRARTGSGARLIGHPFVQHLAAAGLAESEMAVCIWVARRRHFAPPSAGPFSRRNAGSSTARMATYSSSTNSERCALRPETRRPRRIHCPVAASCARMAADPDGHSPTALVFPVAAYLSAADSADSTVRRCHRAVQRLVTSGHQRDALFPDESLKNGRNADSQQYEQNPPQIPL